MKTLGILGGMGPYATITFYRMLIELSAIRYGAVRNADYPHFLLSNLPVPDLITTRESEETAVRMVEEEIICLERARVDFFVLACNTMHLYLERFRRVSSVPFLSMVDAVVETVHHDGRSVVGLLGSTTSIQSELYDVPLRGIGVRCIVPSPAEQDLVSDLIAENIAGNRSAQDERAVYGIVDHLRDAGAQAVVLGCTELPLALQSAHCSLPIYDSLRLLAEAACKEIYSSIQKSPSWRTSA